MLFLRYAFVFKGFICQSENFIVKYVRIVSSLKRLIEKEARYEAVIPLLFTNCTTFSFKFSNAWLFLIEVSVLVFVDSSEVFLIVSVTGSSTFLYSREHFP